MKDVSIGQITMIIGLPRCGKTLFAAKLAKQNERDFDKIVCTPDIDLQQEYFSIPVYVLDVHEIFRYRWERTLFILDEGSLNGLDARAFMKNFAGGHGERLLATCKTLGHAYNAMIVTNHSMTDTDTKLRDAISGTFFRARGTFLRWWCIVEQLVINWEYVPEQGKYCATVDEQGFLLTLLSGGYRLIRKSKWGKLYNSWSIPPILAGLSPYGGCPAREEVSA